jgi:hypothetical protein
MDHPTTAGVSRRTALKRLGAAGALTWAAPALVTSTRAFATDGTPGPCAFSVNLVPTEGSGSVPGPCAAVAINSQGSGHADVSIDLAALTVSWTVTWTNLTTPVILGHIHDAPFPCNGNVVVDFTLAGGTSGTETDSASIDQALAESICADPARYYVNVHTTSNPGGEIRGQLA